MSDEKAKEGQEAEKTGGHPPVASMPLLSCSFCNKSVDAVKLMVAGSTREINICNECIGICCEIMFDRFKEMTLPEKPKEEKPDSEPVST